MEIDPNGAFEFFKDDWNLLKEFVVESATIDPQAAGARMIEATRTNAIPSVAEALVLRSPERSLELIKIWKEASDRGYDSAAGATRFAFARLFATDREKALAMVDALPAEQRIGAMEGIAAAMARANLRSAQEWAEALADPKERAAAIGALVVEMGRSDPDAAVPFLAELDKPFAWNQPGAAIVREMIKKDPRAAIDWMGRHFKTQSHEQNWAQTFLLQSFWSAGAPETILAIAATADETLRANLIGGLRRRAPFSKAEEMLPRKSHREKTLGVANS